MATVLLVAVATFFAAMGVYALAAPAALARPFGIVIATPEARSEIRAVYGGSGWRSRPCSWWRRSTRACGPGSR